MQLTTEQIHKLQLYMENILLCADTTHDLNHRFEIIIDGCTTALTYLDQKGCSLPEVPGEIILLFRRLYNRTRATLVRGDDRVSDELRMQALELTELNYSTLQQAFHNTAEFGYVSKQEELIDDLVRLVEKTACDVYVTQKRSESSQSLLGWLNSYVASPPQEHAITLGRRAVSGGIQYRLLGLDDAEDIRQLYEPLITEINTYVETRTLDINTTEAHNALQTFIRNSVNLLANDVRYKNLSTEFFSKLTELQAYIYAEQQGERVELPICNTLLDIVPVARPVDANDLPVARPVDINDSNDAIVTSVTQIGL